VRLLQLGDLLAVDLLGERVELVADVPHAERIERGGQVRHR